jgi:hypothetical protein
MVDDPEVAAHGQQQLDSLAPIERGRPVDSAALPGSNIRRPLAAGFEVNIIS